MDTPVDRAVIMARGLGTRMRRAMESDPAAAGASLTTAQNAAADAGLKALVPLGGRPFLDYMLAVLAQVGYRRVCLVIGPEHDAMREYYGKSLKPARLAIDFAIQERPLGTADAIAAAERWTAGEPFIALNCDNYYPIEACRALRHLEGCALPAFTREGLLRGNIPSGRIAHFAILHKDEAGNLTDIIEKPDPARWPSGPGDLVSMNLWRFTPAIFAACRAIGPSPRGELELVDAVRYAMQSLDERFRVLTFDAPVLDLSSRADIAAVAGRLAGTTVEL